MSQPSVSAYYNQISKGYDRARFGGAYLGHVAEREETFVAGHLPAQSKTALEVGPGTGRFTRILAERVQSVTACDISREMLDRTRERVGNKTNVEYLLKGIEALGELPLYGKYDVAVAMRIIPHVPRWEEAIHVLSEAVRPGGLVVFDLWNRHSYVGLVRAIFRRRSDVLTHRLSRAEIRGALQKAPVEVAETMHWGYPRVGAWSLDALGTKLVPSFAYCTVFCCRRPTASAKSGHKHAA